MARDEEESEAEVCGDAAAVVVNEEELQQQPIQHVVLDWVKFNWGIFGEHVDNDDEDETRVGGD